MATTAGDYVERAVALASHRDRVRALRVALRDRMVRSPLLDASAFARDLENALVAMLARTESS